MSYDVKAARWFKSADADSLTFSPPSQPMVSMRVSRGFFLSPTVYTVYAHGSLACIGLPKPSSLVKTGVLRSSNTTFPTENVGLCAGMEMEVAHQVVLLALCLYMRSSATS